MGFMDKLGRNKKKATLPRNARVVRRQRRHGGSDTGYYDGGTFFLLDGSTPDSYDYIGGDTFLSTNDARNELADCGYDANDYSAPSDSGSSSYDSGSNSCDTGGTSSYEGSSGYDSSPSTSGSSSYDSGYSGGSSYDSGSSSGSYDSGSSSGSYDSGSSSSYDSGSSSSYDSGSSW
jgi:hypothetical protein